MKTLTKLFELIESRRLAKVRAANRAKRETAQKQEAQQAAAIKAALFPADTFYR